MTPDELTTVTTSRRAVASNDPNVSSRLVCFDQMPTRWRG